MAYGEEVVQSQPLVISGYRCAGCGTRYAERVEWCLRCFRSGVCIPDFSRKTDRLVPATRRRFTARELAARDRTKFPLAAYPEIEVESDAFGIIHGGPNSGKTTMLLRMCEKATPSSFLAAEMKCGPALSEYLRRLEIRTDKMEIFDPAMMDEIFSTAASGITFLAIDSISVLAFVPDDLVAIAKGNNIIVVGILQETKAGQAAGSNAWLHMADFIVKCEDMNWTIEKSRYQSITGAKLGVL